MQDPFFSVDEGEVCVRAEAEERGRIMRHIMLHIQHAGLLIASEQCADRIPKRNAGILQILQGIQAENAWPLVIHDAAPEQITILLTQREGV